MSRFIVVDRVEGTMAVLVADDGQTFNVPKRELPRGSGEGTVLRVEGEGEPDWKTASVDERERKRRLAEEEQKLKELRERDPGGDIG